MMKAAVSTLTRRGRAKAEEAARQAVAADAANKAVLNALEGWAGDERMRRADALLDAAITAHVTIHGADVTAPRLSKTSGQIYPATPDAKGEKFARAEALLRGAA